MAYDDFRDHLNDERAEDDDNLEEEEDELEEEDEDKPESSFDRNSAEAWEQIKSFFAEPAHWIVGGIALLLVVAGIFTVKFLGAIHAPELPTQSGPITLGEDTRTPAGAEDEPLVEIDDIDDSNTVQPILTGARKEDFYTFLLIATDASSSNTDTLMVVSYDVKNQKLNLMSIPRDTMVNVSWDIKKINSVYSMSGLKGLKKHIGKLIGFVPDYYVMIDLEAFISVVDLIGGVDFDVPYDMNYDDPAQDLHIHFKKGMQHLNGQQAMEVVRWRKNNVSSSGSITGYDDVGRIQTQQAFLKETLKQALQIRNWTKITSYVEIFEKNVQSDLELGNMLWFARQAMDLKAENFMTCTIPGDPYGSVWSRSVGSMQSYVTLYPKEVIRLVNESFNPYLADVTMANLDVMSINADGSVSSSTGYVADSVAALPPTLPEPEDDEPEEEEEPDGEKEDETGEETDEQDGKKDNGNDNENDNEKDNGADAGKEHENSGESGADEQKEQGTGSGGKESGTGAETGAQLP